MKINHNISALVANGHLSRTNSKLDKSMERLSSGYRINCAADDAAGMAISQKMKTQIRGLEQSSRNASDGISVIQTAEGALNEVGAMLQRARELSVQAANGTNTAEDRIAIQEEIEQLKSEIQRISDDTEFNKKTLLNGDLSRKTYSNNTKVKIVSLSDEVDSRQYEIKVVEEAKPAEIPGDFVDTATFDEAGKILINGEEVKIEAGESWEKALTDIKAVCDRTGIKLEVTEGTGTNAGERNITFTAIEAGSHRTIEIHCDPAIAGKLGFSDTSANTGTDAEISISKTITETDTTTNTTTTTTKINDGFTSTTTCVAKGNMVTITDQNGFEVKIEILEGAATNNVGTTPDDDGVAKLVVLDAGPMTLQIGANEGQDIDISIPEVSPKTLEIENINVLTQDGASESITLLDSAIGMVSSIRAKLGAYQNRMDHAIANLDVAAQNLTEALSRIEDVNMATEMATYTQQNVLSQAGISMLAQANERPQQILSLLQ